MAFLIPDNLKSRRDVPQALRRVAGAFQVGLDDDVLVWFEPLYDPQGDKPHFVLLFPDRGIAVLEVVEAKAKQLFLGVFGSRFELERDGTVQIRSPLERAGLHAAAIQERLRADPRLSELPLGVVPAAVFPALTRDEAGELKLGKTLDLERCLFKQEIDAAVDGVGAAGLLRAFARMLGPSLPGPVSRAQVDVLRGIVQPALLVDSISGATPGDQGFTFRQPEGEQLVRVLDRQQEALAKGLGEGHRIVRGVAGSGKTLVLVYRARLVASANPSKRFLVTCFTKTLAGQLQTSLRDVPNVTVQHLDGLMADVIRNAGLHHPGYQDNGERVAEVALGALRPKGRWQYHGVFLDEAQDFGTTALRFVVRLLEPGSTDLVIVADAAQNIFRRRFSWRQAGIQAQGRTRILRTNYRNTGPILEFAYRFLTGGGLRADELADLEDESTVIPPEAAKRSGPTPELRLTPSPARTVAETVNRVRGWLERDHRPRSVAVLYASSRGPVGVGLCRALRAAGIPTYWATDPNDKDAKARLSRATEAVILSTIHSAKGLEFPRVALCEIGRPEDDAEAARKLTYVAMTRATEELLVVTEETHRLAAELSKAIAPQPIVRTQLEGAGAPIDPRTGGVVGDTYVLEALLGAGGMASVYRARHRHLGSLHAIKLLDPSLASRTDALERFLDEGRIQATLIHPNIVRVTDLIRDPPGLVMEFVEGESLASALGRERFAAKDAQAILHPVLGAVAAAHASGIVHRDLKPDNILLRRTPSGLVPLVTDFGIAKLQSGANLTRTRATLGTPAYMSPEQVRSAKAVDHRTDLFALGAILYELVTGKPAFGGESDFAIQQNILEGRYEPPDRIVTGLPPWVAAAIRRALATDPEARFQSCQEMAAALRGPEAGRAGG